LSPDNNRGIDIELVWGVGRANTSLGSFDSALCGAGIHNYNLVTLSSVIPEDATVIKKGKLEENRWGVGEMVGVVMAKNTGTEPGSKIAAGLGWIEAEEGGVFMEHDISGTREECDHELKRNLEDAKRTRDWDWTTEMKTKILEATVKDVESVVVASVYRPLALK